MARNKQQLINYHTSNKTSMPAVADVEFGEIVVRHNAEAPEILVKVLSGSTEQFATFVDKDAVEKLIQTSQTTLGGEIEELSHKLEGVSGTVRETYWTSAETKTYVDAVSATVKSAYYTSAETKSYVEEYVDAAISGANADITTIKGDISELKGRASAISGTVSAFSATIVSDYATKVFAQNEAKIASGAAVTTVVGTNADAKTADTVYGAKAYAKDQTDTLSGNVVTALATQKTTLEGEISSLSGSVVALETSVQTFSGDVIEYVDEKLVTVYKYQGSVADYASLPESGKVQGYVYNVVAAHGSTPAGTNYAWTGTEWDPLGGSIDTSIFITSAAVVNAITTVDGKATEAQNRADYVSGQVKTLSASVVSNYATKEFAQNEAKVASGSAVTSAKTYTDSKFNELSGITSAYVATKLTTVDGKATEAQNRADYVSGQVKTLSASVVSNYATKVYAQNEAKTASGAAVTSANSYTDSKFNELSGITSAYVATKLTTINGDINSLQASASTYWNKVYGEAIRGGKLGTAGSTNKTTQSGAAMSYTAGGNIVLDLSSLKIDCGEF